MTTRIWKYGYFNPDLRSKNLVFHVKKMSGCSISENFNFLFVVLLSSYKIYFDLNCMVIHMDFGEFFSENSSKIDFLKNHRKIIFFFMICQFLMCILLFSIARNPTVTFLNYEHMQKNKFC